MAILPVVYYPDPRLRKITPPVGEITDDIRRFCADLTETMLALDGVGIAAPQVGSELRLFILNCISISRALDGAMFLRERPNASTEEHSPMVFVNPEILESFDESEMDREGCLSFPNIYVNISRAPRVKLAFVDLDGKRQEVYADGLWARAVQHELDHLNGRLMIDYLSNIKRDSVKKKMKIFARRNR